MQLEQKDRDNQPKSSQSMLTQIEPQVSAQLLIESYTSHLEQVKAAKEDLEAVIVENETQALILQSKKMVTLMQVLSKISGDSITYLAEQT